MPQLLLYYSCILFIESQLWLHCKVDAARFWGLTPQDPACPAPPTTWPNTWTPTTSPSDPLLPQQVATIKVFQDFGIPLYLALYTFTNSLVRNSLLFQLESTFYNFHC